MGHALTHALSGPEAGDRELLTSINNDGGVLEEIADSFGTHC